MFKFILLSLLLISSSLHAMDSQTSDLQLTWGDRQAGTGLHVAGEGKDKQGKKWTVHETQIKDMSFHQDLLGDIEVVKTIGSGKPVPKEEMEGYVQDWVDRFAQGIPSARMIIKQDETPVGSVQLGQNKNRPGVGDVIRAFTKSAQGKGLGTAALGFLVKEYAPAVRKIALGQDVNAPASAVDKFKCFGGQELRLIYTTARPSNVASWGSYKHFDFQPSQPTDTTHTISCVGWEKPADKPLDIQYQSLEAYVIDKHFSPTSIDPLQVNVLYQMLDDKDTPRTLSYVKNYKSLRFHFEREVESVKH